MRTNQRGDVFDLWTHSLGSMEESLKKGPNLAPWVDFQHRKVPPPDEPKRLAV